MIGRWRRSIVVLVGLVTLAAACSPGGESSSESVPAAPSDTATTQPETPDVEPRAPTSGPAEASEEADDGQTDDGETDDGETDDGDESEYLFDQNRLHTFELTLTEENLVFLDNAPAAEEYVAGELTFEGETIPVGIRYKGSVGSFMGCTGDGGGLTGDPEADLAAISDTTGPKTQVTEWNMFLEACERTASYPRAVG